MTKISIFRYFSQKRRETNCFPPLYLLTYSITLKNRSILLLPYVRLICLHWNARNRRARYSPYPQYIPHSYGHAFQYIPTLKFPFLRQRYSILCRKKGDYVYFFKQTTNYAAYSNHRAALYDTETAVYANEFHPHAVVQNLRCDFRAHQAGHGIFPRQNRRMTGNPALVRNDTRRLFQR